MMSLITRNFFILYTVLLILGIIDIIYSIIDTRNFWFYIQYYWYSELLILYTVLLSLLSFIYSRDRQPTRNFHTRSWAPKIKQQFINERFNFFLKKATARNTAFYSFKKISFLTAPKICYRNGDKLWVGQALTYSPAGSITPSPINTNEDDPCPLKRHLSLNAALQP